MSEIEEVIIFLPSMNDAWLLACIGHCGVHGYVYSIVIGNEAAVGETLLGGRGEIRRVIVARAEHFQPAWWPRLEVAGETARPVTREVAESARTPPAERPAPPRSRRPNIVHP